MTEETDRGSTDGVQRQRLADRIACVRCSTPGVVRRTRSHWVLLVLCVAVIVWSTAGGAYAGDQEASVASSVPRESGWVGGLQGAPAEETDEVALEAQIESHEVVPGDADSYLRAGIAAHEAVEHERAAGLLEEALRLRPELAEAEFALARVELARGQRAEGMERLKGLTRLGGVLAGRAHKDLALAYAFGREPALAGVHFEKSVSFLPDDLELHLNLGISLLARGRAEESVPFLEAVLAMKPEADLAFLTLGRALLVLGRTEEAIRCFKRVQEIDPGRPAAAYELARIEAERGRKDAARALYDQAAKQAAKRRNGQMVLKIRMEQNQL